MRNPTRTLPRAIMAAIALVMIIYVGVAVGVFGNLSPQEAVAAKDFALAEAAKPIFGELGFRIVSVTALFATASAINAGLYAAANVTYQLAKDGELTRFFGEPIGNSREGLIISSIIIIGLAISFDLSSIAIIGAISMLIIHVTVHIDHLRVIKETGASVLLVILSIVANGVALALGLYHLSVQAPSLLGWIAALAAFSFVIELILHHLTGRVVSARATP